MDRAIVIKMMRKPRSVVLARFDGRKVESEGKEFGRKLCRFVSENSEKFAAAERKAPRPSWLNDRACDNWSTLFATATLAGGQWPERGLVAARAISEATEERDLGEILVQDVAQIFGAESLEAIKSGDLVTKLNELECSPWGDFRKGSGISTHKLARMLKSFGIESRQSRTSDGVKLRGYFADDLKFVFEQYLEVGQWDKSNSGGALSGFQSGTENEACPTVESPETGVNTDFVPLSHLESPQKGVEDTPTEEDSETESELLI